MNSSSKQPPNNKGASSDIRTPAQVMSGERLPVLQSSNSLFEVSALNVEYCQKFEFAKIREDKILQRLRKAEQALEDEDYE